MDKEVRQLRESALDQVPHDAVSSIVQECLRQQAQYIERRSSGTLTSSWLLTPRVSMAGGSVASHNGMQGATSLAGPCLDTGPVTGQTGFEVGRLSPVPEAPQEIEAA